MSAPTEVELVWIKGKIERWIRFGRPIEERILDRRRRVLVFAPGSIFAFVRWAANDFGTLVSRLDILRACCDGEPRSTIPGVKPGAEILLRLSGWEAHSCPGCDTSRGSLAVAAGGCLRHLKIRRGTDCSSARRAMAT